MIIQKVTRVFIDPSRNSKTRKCIMAICDFCGNEIVSNRGRHIIIDPKDVGKLCSEPEYLICDNCIDKYGQHLNNPLMYMKGNDDVDKEQFKEQILDTILSLEKPLG